jgi:cysteine desulfurase
VSQHGDHADRAARGTPAGAYLDHAATTPMRPEAVEAMLPYLSQHFGNPSGSHAVARRARRALDEAREEVAAALGAQPGEVVFTAGGTEADNLAVCGAAARAADRAPGGAAVLCSAIEHHAVLHATRAVGGRTFPAGADGTADLDALAATLAEGPAPALVSLMLVNNEVGTVQPLAEAADLVADLAPGALVHTDAVQAVPWLDVATAAAPADLVAVSAHKFGGPKGVGALVVRRRAGGRLAPVLHGGGQERDLRSGTHNVAGIVAMAAALSATVRERDEVVARVGALRDRLAEGLVTGAPGVAPTAASAPRVAGTCHVSIEGVEAEELLLLLDRAGVAASAGSSCASGAIEPSHVLLAMGMPTATARTCVRFSLGPTTTRGEVDTAVAAVLRAAAMLRE